METPGVKSLLRFKLPWLKTLAKELDLSDRGNKIQLARKISEAQEKEHTRIWRAISGPLRKGESA